jgi:hypothetical protein
LLKNHPSEKRHHLGDMSLVGQNDVWIAVRTSICHGLVQQLNALVLPTNLVASASHANLDPKSERAIIGHNQELYDSRYSFQLQNLQLLIRQPRA